MDTRRTASRVYEIALGVLFLGLGVVGYAYVPGMVKGWAFALPGTTDNALSPEFFPKLVFCLVMAAAGGVLVTTPRRVDILPAATTTRREAARVLAIAATVLAGLASMRFLGFAPAASLISAVMLFIVGYPRKLSGILVLVLFTIAVMAGFRYGMRVILPPGALGWYF